MGRYLANKYFTYQNHITCFLIDEGIEEIIREGIRFNEKGSYLSIDPEHQLNIVKQIQETYQANQKLKITPVIVTQLDVRRYLRAMIKPDLPYVAVLSYQELEKYAVLDSIGVIDLG
jgi:type III secretion protein V